jgi:hypothetical protein
MSKYRVKGTTTRALTDQQVINYRKAYEEKRMSRREIMLEAGVSMGTVDRMLNGETYQHLGLGERKDWKEMAGVTQEEIDASARRLMERFGVVPAADEMLGELEGMPPNPLEEA